MTYLFKRKGHYYYNRRVPDFYRDLDPRDLVRIALKTDSLQVARRRAVMLNDEVEAYWQSLVAGEMPHDDRRFKKTLVILRRMGFTYQPLSVVAALPIAELTGRVLALKDAEPKQVEAVLGGREEPEITLRAGLDLYWKLSKATLLHKAPDQVRKWRNPRTKAVSNFIAVVGNKPIRQISRDQIMAFRDWWLERITSEGKNPASANKDLINLKSVLDTVAGHLKLGLDVVHLFKKTKLNTRFKQTRLPFTAPQIVTLFNDPRLQDLNTEARWALFAAAETGARPSELVGLQPEDIRLDHPVPHIAITDRKERMLKTAHSERTIPLVGYALEAFRACPQGFLRYRGKPDNLTNVVSKFLKESGLRPTSQHSLYSMRHGFQDRILKVNAPDRVQAELMGHKFNRPQYGDGAGLEQKKEWLDKICVKPGSGVAV